MAYCDRCNRYFPTWRSLEQHWIQSSAHDYCQHCDEHFDDSEDLENHFEQSHYYCGPCRKVFASDYGLKEHYRQSPQHYYCPPCDRRFQNENNLRNHLRSSVHSQRNVNCPFGCGMSFIENSHLVLHLEGGACSSGINRNTVNKLVRQYDTSSVITDPSRLITAGSSGDAEIKYIATGASWNGRGFECYLCHNEFSYLKALNQHLASPRHQEKFYICRGPDCASRFSTLSALCQHIESGKCGVQKFRVVRDAMDNLFGNMKRLTF